MSKLHIPRPKTLRFHHQPTEHWKDSDAMHEVLHSFPGYFKALLLELLAQPMSHEEFREAMRRLETRMAAHHKRDFVKADLDKELRAAVERNVLEEQESKYRLTPAGREMAEHMQAAIPLFFETILSTTIVSIVTIVIHVLLSVFKLAFGFISGSAGLIADGIDNTADTLSSVLVWLGIKFDREKPVSFFIVIMMFVSVGGVALASINKIVHPAPVREGLSAFVTSAVCGILMLLLSVYQYLVGKRQSNFAIMCQAVDSRNHFLTSLLVCGGIVLSFLAGTLNSTWSSWLLYADALASIIIGFLILQSAFELAKELIRAGDEPTQIAHFMRSSQENMRKKIIFAWLSQELKDAPLTRDQLEERFTQQFCRQTPKILELSGIGYCPESSGDLHRHLKQFVREKTLVLAGETYALVHKRIRDNPFICFFVTIGNVLGRRIHFSQEYIGKTLNMDDGQRFTIFRHVTLDTAKGHSEETPAVFIVRFKFAKLSQQANRIASFIPIPLIVGAPGFRDKIWMVNEETGYWQGVYQWESEQAVEEYQNSFVLGMMNKRSIQETLSYTIFPNTRLSEFMEKHVIAAETPEIKGS